MRTSCVVPLIVTVLSAGLSAEARTWSDQSGRFKVEAEFESLKNGVVTLRKADAKDMRIPLDELCDADQEHIRSLTNDTNTPQDNEGSERDRPKAGAKPSAMASITADGSGATADEALRDAFRNAVRQAVGAIVDAETLIKNDEVIDDKVLTYSNGLIKSYEELAGSKKVKDGLHRIKINAKVERRSVIAKLTAANIRIKGLDGKGLFAETVTQLDAEKDAAALLRKQFEGFPQSCITATVIGKPVIIEKKAETATVRLTVRVEPDLKAYRAFTVKLIPILNKLATSKGEFTALFREYKDDTPKSETVARSHMVPATIYNVGPDGELHGGELQAARVENTLPAWLPKIITYRRQPLASFETTVLSIAVGRTSKGDKIDYRYFELDASLRSELLAIATRGGEAKVQLLDGNREVVKTERFKSDSLVTAFNAQAILRLSGGQTKYHDYDQYAPSARIFFVNNVFFYSRDDVYMYHRPFVSMPVDMTLSLDELKSVKDAKVEITFDE